MKRDYDWYELEEKFRNELYLKNEIIVIQDRNYLPVLWDNEYINYGEKYGLLYFPKIYGGHYNNKKDKDNKWFGVRVFSPDDWDLDFDIDLERDLNDSEADIKYNDLVNIVKNNVACGPVDYKDLFDEIKREYLLKYPNAKYY